MRRRCIHILCLLSALISLSAQAQKKHNIEFRVMPQSMSEYFSFIVSGEVGHNEYEEIGQIEGEGKMQAEAGKKVYVQYYDNMPDYYRVDSIKLDNEVVKWNNGYIFTMPDHDVTMTWYTRFDFNPESPAEPNLNAWNRATGEVFLDAFPWGWASFYRENAYTVVTRHGATMDDIKILTIVHNQTEDAGINLSNIVYDMNNVEVLDLSRVMGLKKVMGRFYIDYFYDEEPYFLNEKLRSVLLPSCVEEVESMIGLCNLETLFLYATTPPALGEGALRETNEGAVLYVPATSVDQYRQSPWGEHFSLIQPIADQVTTVTLHLPEAYRDGALRNMRLELVNDNGQVLRNIITDQNTYTFSNIIKRTHHRAIIRTTQGAVLGKIGDIQVDQSPVEATFGELQKIHQVRMMVEADGKDVTDHTTITWFDADGNYLAKGKTLSNQVVLDENNDTVRFRYQVQLDRELAGSYMTPSEGIYTMIDGNNMPTLSLQPIRLVTVKGSVLEAGSGIAIDGATVVVKQTIAGKYENTLTGKTGVDGSFQVDGLQEQPFSVSVAAEGYVGTTLEVDSLKDEVSLQLARADGVRLQMKLTNQSTPTEEYMAWRVDLSDITPEVINVTTGEVITAISVQQSDIILLDGVSPGDRVALTLRSKDGSFTDVRREVTIGEDKTAAVDAVIVQNGVLDLSFRTTENQDVLSYVFDSGGALVAKANYTDAKAQLTTLTDGTYQVVTMGQSPLFQHLPTLSSLTEVGLERGKDFLQEQVKMTSGEMVQLAMDSIPLLDQTRFFYTTENTYFKINKSSGTAGTYLTLSSRVELKPEYADASGVTLNIDLPTNVSYVEGSMVLENKVADCLLDGQRLIIKLADDELGKKLKFCVVANRGGNYSIGANLAFRSEGKQLTQPMGSVRFEAEDISLNMASTTASRQFTVSGKALAGSMVDVYTDGTVIGHTMADERGLWSAECTLFDAYNLTTFPIHAVVTNPMGVELTTATQNITYDSESIQLSKASILYWNPEMQKSYTCTWDFLDPSQSQVTNYIYYVNNREFTFTAEFTKNDPELVHDVWIGVKTGKQNYVALEAEYDELRKKWVAHGSFGDGFDGDIPVSLSVDFETTTRSLADRAMLEEIAERPAAQQKIDLDAMGLSSKELLDLISEQLAKDEPDFDYLQLLENKLASLYGMPRNTDAARVKGLNRKRVTQEEFDAMEKRFQELQNSPYMKIGQELDEMATADPQAISKFMEGYVNKTCDGLTPEQLLADGFSETECTDGSKIYIKVDNVQFTVVDFANDSYISYPVHYQAGPNRVKHKIWPFTTGFTEDMDASAKELYDYADQIKNILSDIASVTEEVLKVITDEMTEVGNMRQIYLNEWEMEKMREMRGLYCNKKLMQECAAKSREYGEMLGTYGKAKKILEKLKIGDKFGKGMSILSLVNNVISMARDIHELNKLYKSVPDPCPLAQETADGIRDGVSSFGYELAAYYLFKVGSDIYALYTAFASVSAAPATGGASLLGVVAALGKIGLNYATDALYDSRKKTNQAWAKKKLSSLVCRKKKNPKDPPYPPSGEPDSDPGQDPSGYVYESVFSNRVEGVTASIYYKDTKEDMYGQTVEDIVLWDAEKYAQENPLFTDANGLYRWDVPAGLWQVKFEKEGYKTTNTEWLPVPPPQLDINVGIQQYKQPEVASAVAYEEGIDVKFDKYMRPSTLNDQTIRLQLIKEGVESNVESVEVTFVNLEEVADSCYASHIRINPSNITLGLYDHVRLTIGTAVESYAGLRMQETYTQMLPIEQHITAICVEPEYAVASNASTNISVQVLPVEAAQGKQIQVVSAQDDIAQVSVQNSVIDAEGKFTFQLTGGLTGMTGLAFRIHDGRQQNSLLADTTTTVRICSANGFHDIPEAPQASRPSGIELHKGQTITLTTATDGATIYYTLDGSCPCDLATRLEYRKPIVVDRSCTIKAMAVSRSLVESEIVEFEYKVAGFENAIFDVAASQPLANDKVYDLAGRRVANEKHYRGIYLRKNKKTLKTRQ